MANLLDQKEEVMTVELTKYGRKLLGLGIFQPEYYAFFDDTVIYDVGYANFSEIQNESKGRILDKSLTISALNTVEDIYLPPLGKSSVDSDYAPAWELSFLNGTANRNESSSSYYENMFDCNNIIFYKSLETNASSVGNNISSYELEDGKAIKIDDDYILIELSELNVGDDYENFKIELITYDDIAGGKNGGLERNLMFSPKQTNIIDGIIYDENELPSRFINQELTKNDAEFYLDVLVDEEIDQAIITKAKTIQEQVKATYTTTFEGPIGPAC
jgi:hypothetical protein